MKSKAQMMNEIDLNDNDDVMILNGLGYLIKLINDKKTSKIINILLDNNKMQSRQLLGEVNKHSKNKLPESTFDNIMSELISKEIVIRVYENRNVFFSLSSRGNIVLKAIIDLVRKEKSN